MSFLLPLASSILPGLLGSGGGGILSTMGNIAKNLITPIGSKLFNWGLSGIKSLFGMGDPEVPKPTFKESLKEGYEEGKRNAIESINRPPPQEEQMEEEKPRYQQKRRGRRIQREQYIPKKVKPNEDISANMQNMFKENEETYQEPPSKYNQTGKRSYES